METRNRHPYNKIKAFFVENKIRHKDVAKILAVKPNTISKKLNGYGADFSLEDANKMHFHFGVPITYFFEPGVPKKERKIFHKE
ncbi:helix-turn-helix domain-containing protein [Bacillus paralicheniformis]|uniref:Helix-turn-helix transcriptional regulator n=1 Tax=Bacillus paralicheniformis TaxID=1648923 RepID=A0ABY3FZE5_9BACI|nr:helix-turn-helix transcriptional regulator [Bacillus paralicheniformis]KND05487.1 hypothetical protein ACJ43_21625 [Bacillus paralicheniformis]MCY1631155.1 helix-turn-helix domain-containing protein [Bacillus paralicheniformis]OLQ49668.1 transcriptional regulator [Bacillus paralicheniformis]TWL42702.1 hypothetical protein CHCC15381_1878 [Bacillus paralicheniformis]WEZ24243.1 helix-turn-helix transcriptional regulator [Bacillus paralicheniformis]